MTWTTTKKELEESVNALGNIVRSKTLYSPIKLRLLSRQIGKLRSLVNHLPEGKP